MDNKKTGPPDGRAGRKRKKHSLNTVERLYRRLLFVIRWSSFDSYWDVVDALEALVFDYRRMLGDSEEIIQKSRELVENLAKEMRQ